LESDLGDDLVIDIALRPINPRRQRVQIRQPLRCRQFLYKVGINTRRIVATIAGRGSTGQQLIGGSDLLTGDHP